MTRTLACTILISAVLLAARSPAQTINDIVTTTVYLHHESVQTLLYDGVQQEVWLKDPNKTAAVPFVAPKESATGFLVVTANNHLYLVTAGHVAKVATPEWEATVRGDNDKPVTVSLAQLISTGKTDWVKNDNADVAVLPLQLGADTQNLLQRHFCPMAALEQTLQAPSRDQPLTALGFPLRLGVGEFFSPISRQTKAASGLFTIPDPELAGRSATFYALDEPSIEGFSGAPVFTWPLSALTGAGLTLGGKLSVVGLFKDTLSDNTGGKLGWVVPSFYIAQTIEKAEQPQRK